MAAISDGTLVIVIQALEAEMRRFRDLPEDEVVPGDEVFYDDMSRAAAELERAYAEAMLEDPDLPAYSQLVGRRS